eukprot:TRINITY_DN4074_c0_g1_i1.p1 TRINITY_DN4074_c0_g1~~TRINITY_DN4074_c0_g1_i1.p1  ORF type:complete len:146 (-),score=54.42 TRINITY_DN4074_c0_g1_i1:3-440(-)
MSEGLELIKERKADILLAYPDHVKTSKDITFANPIYSSNVQIFLSNRAKDVKDKPFDSLEQFNQQFTGGVIGIWQDSTFKEQLIAKYPALNVRYFSSLSAMLNAAERDEISGIAGLVDLINARLVPHVLCVDTGRSSETAKAHRG